MKGRSKGECCDTCISFIPEGEGSLSVVTCIGTCKQSGRAVTDSEDDWCVRYERKD